MCVGKDRGGQEMEGKKINKKKIKRGEGLSYGWE